MRLVFEGKSSLGNAFIRSGLYWAQFRGYAVKISYCIDEYRWLQLG